MTFCLDRQRIDVSIVPSASPFVVGLTNRAGFDSPFSEKLQYRDRSSTNRFENGRFFYAASFCELLPSAETVVDT